MLRNCVLPTSYSNNTSKRCGEIVCSGDTAFTIICTFCKKKLFDFEEFVFHYSNAHLNALEETAPPLKNEEPQPFEEFVFLKDQEPICDDADEVPIFKIEEIVQLPQTMKYEKSECDSAADEGDTDWEPEVESELNDGGEEETDVKPILKRPRVPKDFKCGICEKRYTTTKYLKIHEKLVHLKPKDYKCDQCNAEFTEERCLAAHKKKIHTEFYCSQCSRVYKTSRSLKFHESTHKATLDFVCNYENCGKAFNCKQRLTSHMKVHTEERNIVCEICGYRTRFKEALKVHIRSHTGERPYICKTCGKAFASRSLMIEHQPIHSSERPHKCEVCGASFSRAKALYHHKHLHLAVKKFVCKICDRAYAQAAGLAGHMRQHRAEMETVMH